MAERVAHSESAHRPYRTRWIDSERKRKSKRRGPRSAAVEIGTELMNGTAYRTSVVTSRTRELVDVDLPDPRPLPSRN